MSNTHATPIRVGIPKEVAWGEYRCAMHPQVVPTLVRGGLQVHIEQDAGKAAGLSDKAFVQAGAQIEPEPAKLWQTCHVILKAASPTQRPDGVDEASWLRQGQVCIALFDPLGNPARIKQLAGSGAGLFAMELVPRTSRAQGMDALSSQANLAGYRSVILAAHQLHKVIPMMMTAGGTVQPARFLVVGAGVAGLQAIATAKRLGARVYAYDVRAAVKEQVESLGAKFVEVDLQQTFEGQGGYAKTVTTDALAMQQQALAKVASGMDAVITTAQIPGRQAPLLITREALAGMKPGSVVVDLACTSGGNVAGSKPDTTAQIEGVIVLGPTNLAAQLAPDASLLYARNVSALLELLIHDGQLHPYANDDIVAATCIARGGRCVALQPKGSASPKTSDKLQSSGTETLLGTKDEA